MKLSAPYQGTFFIAVFLAVIGVIAHVAPIAALAQYALWLVVAGFVLLALGTLVKNL